jgi:hypothetical protein
MSEETWGRLDKWRLAQQVMPSVTATVETAVRRWLDVQDSQREMEAAKKKRP